jgi:hypothetical protein
LFVWLASGGSLVTLRDAPCLSCDSTLIKDKLSGRIFEFLKVRCSDLTAASYSFEFYH